MWPVERTRVIIHPDGLVCFPIHQSGCFVPVEIEIFRDECLQSVEIVPHPFRVSVHVPDDKSGVLSQCRFVHVAFPRIATFEHLFPAGGVTFYPYGNPPVHTPVIQRVEYTTLFISECLPAVSVRTVFE